MATFEYNPIAEFLTLTFVCPKCGNETKCHGVAVPSPDFSAETHHDSVNSDWCEVYCEHCDEEYEVTLNTGFYGGDGEIEGVEDVYVDEEFSEDDSDYYDQMLYDATHTEVEKTLDNIGILPEETKKHLYKLLYSNVITSMEAFLGDTLKRQVLKDEQSIRRFVESYKPYKHTPLSLASLFTKKEALPKLIRTELDAFLYHDLKKIKPIYKAALGVDLGDVSDIYKAVLIRHDIVHRDGKSTDGTVTHKITEDMVRDISNKVKDMIDRVSSQLSPTAKIDINELLDGDVLPFESI